MITHLANSVQSIDCIATIIVEVQPSKLKDSSRDCYFGGRQAESSNERFVGFFDWRPPKFQFLEER